MFQISENKLDLSSTIKIAAAVTVVSSGVIYLGKILHSYSFFESRGIPTPKYRYVTGNLRDITSSTYSDKITEWTNKFGKTYGYYEGHSPILVTSDLEIIQDVFFDQFENFTGRKVIAFFTDDQAPVFGAAKNRWKRFRSIINPAFSPAKLKLFIPLIRTGTNRLIDLVQKQEEKEINLTDHFKNFALDVAWSCGYGLDLDCQNNPGNPILTRIKEFFLANNDPFPLFLICFRELKPFIFPPFNFVSKLICNFAPTFFWLQKQVNAIVELRSDPKNYRKDFVQMLLESKASNIDKIIDDSQYDQNNLKFEKRMTMEEIQLNLGIFLFAGMETVSSTLSFCVHHLIEHPDEQVKIQDEIDALFDITLEADDEIYAMVNKFQYLDMFIKESMRLLPAASGVINRRCTKHTVVKGIDMPEDLIVSIDVNAIHLDSTHWGTVDAKTFYPLRFSPDYERNKKAYMPFGLGIMNCLGMKFALLEMKLALIRLLKDYDVIKTNEEPLKVMEMVDSVRQPVDGLKCAFKKRAF